MDAREHIARLLQKASITLDGPASWDPKVRDERVFDRVLGGGVLALGETYMDGWWDADDLSELTRRALDGDFADAIWNIGLWKHVVRARIFNLQSVARAFQVGKEHYDIGSTLYERMLDPRMAYSCGYWSPSPTHGDAARNLAEAQERKLDLVCKKIGLKAGDRVLDIGCGWGSFSIYAAEKYGARVVGLTISERQAALARERAKGLPVEIVLKDYREYSAEPFDHIVSIGMFEHVGHKNYRTYMEVARRLLKPEGLFLLHTIGVDVTPNAPDPWLDKYIFPNGILPSPRLIAEAAEGLFVLEDWHDFGADYDTTLCAWWENFDTAWPELKKDYDEPHSAPPSREATGGHREASRGERFYRMWRYYLLTMAGSFRARHTNLWQIVLSPKGVRGGYRSVR